VSEPEGAGAHARHHPRRGLIVDWGGVLTTPLREAIAEWIRADGIDGAHYRQVLGAWFGSAYADARYGGIIGTAGAASGTGTRTGLVATAEDGGSSGAGVEDNPIHGLETGTLDPAEFERLLAARLRTLDGSPIVPDGLLARMFAGFRPVEEMYEALRRARAGGVRTCLLSNSWGDTYPREVFSELFDAVVISAEVGMRKPSPEIFRHALDLIALAPEATVFVDDISHNVRAAEALGIIGVHHREVAETVRRLEELLSVPLR
jgi:putative hydrolase of the HAD superfamily